MKTDFCQGLKIKLSFANDEHLISAWVRHNLRCGFAHLSFGQCLRYWKLPNQYLKSGRISGDVIERILLQAARDSNDRQSILMNTTNARLWSLSGEAALEVDQLSVQMIRSNLESSGLAFTQNWQLCPSCVRKEMEELGFCYWHRSHQLPSVTHCVEHESPLLSHDSLKSMGELSLPNQYLDVCMLEEPALTDELLHWSKFVAQVDYKLAGGLLEPATLRSSIVSTIGLPEFAKTKDRPIYQELSNQIIAEVGSSISRHLFKFRNGTPPNLLWLLFSGKSKRESLLNPVYWLVVLYWLETCRS